MNSFTAMSATKPKQIRIRITEDDEAVLEQLKGKILSETDVASMLLHAACEAVRMDGASLRFPISLAVAGGTEANERFKLNEPTTYRPKKPK